MRIEETIRYKNIDTYRKLKKIGKEQREIKLGDRPEKLMQHDSYRREGRRIRQVKWG